MVIGVDRFRDHFAGHEHQYVLIGGAACEQVMDEAGLEFRRTKDLDIVLIVEALDAAFSEAFLTFVKAGDYEVRQNGQGERRLYRFQKPKVEGYPFMLELFARKPDGLDLSADATLTPLPIDEEAASLSAILLDENYYALLKTLVRIINGIPVLDETGLIPFKARAWLDLSARFANGEAIDRDNIRKHRNDVARLVQVLPAGVAYEVSDSVRADLAAFTDAAEADETWNPRQFDVPMDRAVVADRLRTAYKI